MTSEQIFEKVAEAHGVTAKEVKEEINRMISEIYGERKDTPEWSVFECQPTAEEFVTYLIKLM